MTALRSTLRLAPWATLLLGAACKVGPDYVAPESTAPDAWHRELRLGMKEGPARLERWWTQLDDPLLDELIEEARSGNPGLGVAIARIRESRAQLDAARGERGPDLNAQGSYNRSKRSQNGANSGVSGFQFEPRDFWTLGLEASWEADFFGRVRRLNEAARADLEASVEAYRDVLVVLLAEVAQAYVDVRLFQERLRIAEGNVEIQARTLELAEGRFETGLSPELDVSQARTTLSSTRAEIPPLRAGMESSMYRLATLLGRNPGDLHGRLEVPAAIPAAPGEITVGLPADVIRQRPDIRRAERELAAQTARIGVATTELYPQFSLVGSLDLQSRKVGDLPEGDSLAWSIGPSFRWNLWDRDRVRSAIEVQDARAERLLHAYEETVLRALEEVETTLVVHAEETLRRNELGAAVEEALRSVEWVEVLYEEGLVDYQNVLDAQRTLFGLQDVLAQSEGRITTNLVGLYRALGGGWQESEPVSAVEED